MSHLLARIMVGGIWLLSVDSPTAQVLSEGPSLTGRVLYENGESPGEAATVVLSCWGDRGPRVQTDKNGTFRIAYGEELRSRPGFRTSRRAALDLNGCEVQASAPGFASAPLRLGRMASSNRVEVGTLYLRPLDDTSNELVSVNSLSAPPKARKDFDEAQKELRKTKPNLGKAVRKLESAVTIFPRYGAAWYLLGQIRIHSGDQEGAEMAMIASAASDPSDPRPFLALSLMNLTAGKFPEASASASKALLRDPESTEALFYLGASAFGLGQAKEAEKHLVAAVTQPDSGRFPRTFYLLGNVLENQQRIDEARRWYLRYLELEPESKAADSVRESLERWAQGRHRP